MRPVSRDLAELRLAAEEALRSESWASLLSYADRLRSEDPESWPHVWAPVEAVAAHATGEDAVGFLREAVEGGFRQPDMLPLESLHELPEWPELFALMSSPAQPPAIEVTAWPTADYGPPLVLDRLPAAREATLADRVPSRSGGAWETARALLEWATTYWEHANDHVDTADALDVLERADAGERFACVEYSVLLSQALNAVGIPSRRVSLRMADQHVGFGRGHVVSEAWIDDLGHWVVLDGQNGAWWGTADEPLGLRELQDREHGGGARPDMCLTAREVSEEDQDDWWGYFHAASASGLEWVQDLVPIFQGQPITARVVVRPSAVTHPDLARIETGAADAGDGPALVFTPTHPFATGVRVGDTEIGVGAEFPLWTLEPGEHDLAVRTVTPYDVLAPQPLTVVRRALLALGQ